MLPKCFCFLQFLIITFALSNSESSYDSISDIYLEHELIPGAGFSNRSSTSINLETKSDIVIESTISHDDLQLIKKLANEKKMYRLKVTVRYSSGVKTSLLTFTKACLILEHKSNHVLTLHLDHLDLPFAANLATKSGICQTTFDDIDTYKFTITVFFRRPDSSPIPDTATYIQKIEREREAREKGKSNNNKSMLGKYWMYILPLVIFMMIAGASNPEAARQ